MFDPGDWLPFIGVSMLAVTTAIAIAGAWALGRARGMAEVLRQRDRDTDTHARLERMEQSLAGVAEEIERLGEVQRFALKLVSERATSGVDVAQLSPSRPITPH